MTAITREYLDAFETHTYSDGAAREAARIMAAALRRVLDLCDDPSTMPDGQKVLTVQRVFDALAGTQTDDGAVGGECASCGEGDPKNECPKSRRPCGHHCNHIWTHDSCDWCGFTHEGDA